MSDETVDIVDVVKALRKAGIHSAGCVYSHDCARAGCGVSHILNGVCTCWVTVDEIKVSK